MLAAEINPDFAIFVLKNGQQIIIRGDLSMLMFLMGELNYDYNNDQDLYDES